MDKEELGEKKSLGEKEDIFEKDKLVIKKELGNKIDLGINPIVDNNYSISKEQEMTDKNIKMTNLNYNKYSNK